MTVVIIRRGPHEYRGTAKGVIKKEDWSMPYKPKVTGVLILLV